MRDFFTRYADRVTPGEPDACWEWTGAVASRGYGHTHFRGEHVYAHRAAYESIHGVGSADGLVVRHKCDNPPCCNPAHLLIGTHKDNMADMWERGRANRVFGEDTNTAVLTEAQVLEARKLARGGMPIARLVERFGTYHSNMTSAVTGGTWKHLPDAVPPSQLVKAKVPGAKPGQGATKMSEEKVRELRKMLASGMTGRAVAKVFGIDPVTVSAIKHGRCWSHVD